MVLLQCLQEEHGVWFHNPRAKQKRTFKIKTQRRGVCVWKCYLLSCVWLFVTPWTIAQQAPLSMEFSKKEYWVGSQSLLHGILSTQGSKLESPALQADSLPSEPPGKPEEEIGSINNLCHKLKTWLNYLVDIFSHNLLHLLDLTQ